jgi:hypothetical protein
MVHGHVWRYGVAVEAFSPEALTECREYSPKGYPIFK